MSLKNAFEFPITDYISGRDKKNSGTCNNCGKQVYWSKQHVVSHIRSGHCPKASIEQVKKFKDEYFYLTPKKLVHRSSLHGKRKSNENSQSIEEMKVGSSKRRAFEETELEVYEELISDNDQTVVDNIQYVMINETNNSSDNAELIVEKANENTFKIKTTKLSNETPTETMTRTKEEKFIAAVYPQYSTMTKLQLIENILEIKKEIDLLKSKCTNYEDTINRLLND